MELALEAGADDVKRVDDKFEVTCDPGVSSPRSARALAHKHPGRGQQRSPASRPRTSTSMRQSAPKVLKLMEQLDDHDDVQSVAVEFQHSARSMAESKNCAPAKAEWQATQASP